MFHHLRLRSHFNKSCQIITTNTIVTQLYIALTLKAPTVWEVSLKLTIAWKLPYVHQGKCDAVQNTDGYHRNSWSGNTLKPLVCLASVKVLFSQMPLLSWHQDTVVHKKKTQTMPTPQKTASEIGDHICTHAVCFSRYHVNAGGRWCEVGVCVCVCCRLRCICVRECDQCLLALMDDGGDLCMMKTPHFSFNKHQWVEEITSCMSQHNQTEEHVQLTRVSSTLYTHFSLFIHLREELIHVH